jgi:hypothetical protein
VAGAGAARLKSVKEASRMDNGIAGRWALPNDLGERGRDADRARVWVIDGGRARRKAVVEGFEYIERSHVIPDGYAQPPSGPSGNQAAGPCGRSTTRGPAGQPQARRP